MKYWLIVNREELIGVDGEKRYDEVYIRIIASSYISSPYLGNYLGSPSIRTLT